MPDLADVELSKKRGGAAAAEEGFSVEDIMKLLLWLTLFTIALIELIFLVILAGKVGTLENQVTGKLDTSALSVAGVTKMLGSQELDLSSSNVKVSKGSITLQSSNAATPATDKATITYDGSALKFAAGGKTATLNASGFAAPDQVPSTKWTNAAALEVKSEAAVKINGKGIELTAGVDGFTFTGAGGPMMAGSDNQLAANKGLSMLAGTGSVDFSLGTGVFKTTTGAHTIGGDVTLSGTKTLTMGGLLTANLGATVTGANLAVTGAHDITIAAAGQKLKLLQGGTVEATANAIAVTGAAGATVTATTLDVSLVSTARKIIGTAATGVDVTATTGAITLTATNAAGTILLKQQAATVATVDVSGLHIAATHAAFIHTKAPLTEAGGTPTADLTHCGKTVYLTSAGVVLTLGVGDAVHPVGCRIKYVQGHAGAAFKVFTNGVEKVNSGIIRVVNDGNAAADFIGVIAADTDGINATNAITGWKKGGWCEVTKHTGGVAAATKWSMDCVLQGTNGAGATTTPVA